MATELVIYGVCFGVGVFLTFLSVMVEHVFGRGTDGVEPVPVGGERGGTCAVRLWSPTWMGTFVAGFGGVGLFVSRLELTGSVLMSVPLSGAGGVVLAMVVQRLCRRWFGGSGVRSDSEGEPDGGTLVMVEIPIPAGGEGRISWARGGMLRTMAARTETGVGVASGRLVRVTRIVDGKCHVEEIG
jgi:hypothetical protein